MGPGGLGLPLSIELHVDGSAQSVSAIDQVKVSLNELSATSDKLHAVNLQPVDAQALQSLDHFTASTKLAGGAIDDWVPKIEAAGTGAAKAGLNFFQLRTAMVGISALGGMNPMVGQMGAAFANLSGTMALISPIMLGVAAAVAVVGGAMVEAEQAATKFDYTMTLLRNNMSVTDAEYVHFTQDTKNLASASGAAWQDVGNAIRIATNSGFQYADAEKVVSAANMEAVGTGAKVGDVTKALALAMHDYHLPATDAMRVTEMLNTTFREGNMTVEEGVTGMGKMTAIAASLHVPLEAVLATYSSLTRSLGDAHLAGTGVVNMLEHMANPTAAATKEMKDLDDQLGLNIIDDMKHIDTTEGYNKVLEDLAIIEQKRPGTLLEIEGGIRGGIAAMAIAGDGTKDYNSILAETSTATNEAINVNKHYQDELETTQGKVNRLTQRFDLLKVSLGEGLSQGVGVGIGALLRIGDAFEGLGSRISAVMSTQVAGGMTIGDILNPHNLVPTLKPFGSADNSGLSAALQSAEADSPLLLQDVPYTTGNMTKLGPPAPSSADQAAQAQYNAETAAGAQDAQYAAMSEGQLKSAKKDLTAEIDRQEGAIDKLRAAEAAAKEAKDPDAEKANQAAITAENATLEEKQSKLKSLNAALEQYTGVKAGASAADQQAALNAKEDLQVDQNALKALTLDQQGLLNGMKATYHEEMASANTKIEEQQAIVNKDAESHRVLASVLKDLKAGFVVSASGAQEASAALDQQMTRLTAENDLLGDNKQKIQEAKDALNTLATSTEYAGKSQRDFDSAVNSAKDAVAAEQGVIKSDEAAIRGVEQSIKSADATLTKYKDTLTNLTTALSAAKTAESDFANAALPGAKGFDDQSEAIKQQMNQVQLQIDQTIGKDLASGMTQTAANADPALTDLNKQLDILRNQLDTVNTQAAVALDPLTKQIKDLEASGNKFDFGTLIEQLNKAQSSGASGLSPIIQQLTALNGINTSTLSFDQITAGITAAQKAQQALTQAIPGANTAVNTQQATVDGLNKTLQAQQDVLARDQLALQGDQDALTKANDARQRFLDLVSKVSGGFSVSDQALSNDQAALSGTRQSADDLTKSYDALTNTTKDNFAPVALDLQKKLEADRIAFEGVTNHIKQEHIGALADASAKSTGLATVHTTQLTPSTADLGNELITHTTPAMADHRDTIGDNSSGTTHNTVLLAQATGKQGLTQTMADMVGPVGDATTAMSKFADQIERAQSDAAKGVNLTIHIATVSASAASTPPGHATGTSYAQGGPSIVGEFGPELLNLPSGAQIAPVTAPRTGGGSGGTPINIIGNTFIGTQTDMMAQLSRQIQTEQDRLVTLKQ